VKPRKIAYRFDGMGEHPKTKFRVALYSYSFDEPR
jgi:hypothetical protein